jgi:hypothetical protein
MACLTAKLPTVVLDQALVIPIEILRQKQHCAWLIFAITTENLWYMANRNNKIGPFLAVHSSASPNIYWLVLVPYVRIPQKAYSNRVSYIAFCNTAFISSYQVLLKICPFFERFSLQNV